MPTSSAARSDPAPAPQLIALSPMVNGMAFTPRCDMIRTVRGEGYMLQP